jgi:hypothetical protein
MCQGFYAPFSCRFFRFQDDVCGAFTQIQSGARSVKRTAGFAVEYHQGIETVEMKFGNTFASSGNHYVGSSVANQLRSQHNGIGSR